MAAPNKEPSGSRPGPKAPNTHAPYKGDSNFNGRANPGAPGNGAAKGDSNGVGGHGTPKGVGANKSNPLH